MISTIKSGKTVEICVQEALKELNATKQQVNIEIIEEPKSGFLGLLGAKDAVVRVSLKEEIELEESTSFVKEILSGTEKTIEKKQKSKIEQVETPVVEKLEEEKEEEPKDSIFSEEKLEKEQKRPRKKAEGKQEFFEEEKESVEPMDKECIDVSRKFLKTMLDQMNLQCDIETIQTHHGLKFNLIANEPSDIGILIGKRGETLDSIQYLVNLIANRYANKYQRVIVDINSYRGKRQRSLEKLAHNMAFRVRKYKKKIKLEPMNPYERRIIHSALQKEKNIMTFSEGEEPNRYVVIRYDK